MHRTPDAHDRAPLDSDSTGHDARAAFAPPLAVTRYQVWHHEHALSREYDTMSEAELFRLFETPGTDDYRVVPVRSTTRTGEPK